MVKIFGAAFDPLDISERIEIKPAYLNWLRTHKSSNPDFLDPYDFLEHEFKGRFHSP